MAAALLAVASGCGSAPVTRTAVGQVAELSAERVCLRGTGAIGICYQAEPGMLDGTRVGDCVRVRAVLKYGRLITRELTAIEPVSAAEHREECPET